MGYTYNKGEYKYQYSEDETKCYIYNNGETASFSQGSTTLYKVLKIHLLKTIMNIIL